MTIKIMQHENFNLVLNFVFSATCLLFAKTEIGMVIGLAAGLIAIANGFISIVYKLSEIKKKVGHPRFWLNSFFMMFAIFILFLFWFALFR